MSETAVSENMAIKEISGERFTPFSLCSKLGAKALLESASFERGRGRYSLLLLKEAFSVFHSKDGIFLKDSCGETAMEAENGDVLGEHSLSETWTNTQVGLERWFTEDIAAKAGWRQNILAYPRNTLFAGACYRPNERWTFNYDYAEGTIAVDKISAFMTLADVINPGGHRITLTYNF